jgi:hypothetical protein
MEWEERHLGPSEDIVEVKSHRRVGLLVLARRKPADIRKCCLGHLTEDQLHWKKYQMGKVLIQGLLFPRRLLPRYQAHSSCSEYGLWKYVPTPGYRLVVLVALASYEIVFPG